MTCFFVILVREIWKTTYERLVKAIKQVDVVISTVGRIRLLDQTKIISAIKEAGNVKRFLPSEFGTDTDRTNAVEPANSLAFALKRQIRRAVEAEGIPYTYVVNNCFAGFYLPTFVQFQPRLTSPSRNKSHHFRRRTCQSIRVSNELGAGNPQVPKLAVLSL
uniref:Isoflavone reductase-like protein P3 n=1 Tax=Noccaea caerulescens TaxID=107243 RepID=A0A1J3H641_NOCCA